MTIAPTPISRGHAPQRTTQILLAALVVLVGAGVVLLARHDWNGSTASSTVKGSGVALTQARTVPAFDGVELAGSNIVSVHVGGRQAVAVTADDNLVTRVTTDVRGGHLVVGTTGGSFSTVTPMHVDVTVPALTSVELSGSGIVSIDGVRATAFRVDVPGSGVVRVSGTATRVDATLGGSGDVQLQDLAARDAKAVVAGSGRLQVDATRSLDASVSGSGAIVYTGHPATVTRNVSGSGAIIER